MADQKAALFIVLSSVCESAIGLFRSWSIADTKSMAWYDGPEYYTET